MIRAVSIVPAILSNNKQDYHEQVQKVNTFTRRVQIDVADNTFVQTPSLDITNVWWPNNWETDLHYMTAKPSENLDVVLKLAPALCIFHAEASENLLPIFEKLKQANIKAGVALMPQTYPGKVKPYIDAADHVLIMAGQLGVQGSAADLMQMEKVALIRNLKPDVEIGWDGGANLSNVRALAHADLDVINVGAALSHSPNPEETYKELVAEIDKNGVVL